MVRLIVCARAVLLVTASLLTGAAQAQWTSLNSSGPTDIVNTLAAAAPFPGAAARLYIGGVFTTVSTPTGSIAAENVASWDGHGFVPGPGLTGEVSHLVVHSHNNTPTLFAAKMHGITSGGVLAYLTDGQWTEMELAGQAYVYGLASFDIGNGRQFALSAAFPNYIKTWNNGVLAEMGTGLASLTKAFAVFDDGNGPRLFAGMTPNAVGGWPEVGRFDGNEWSSPPGAPDTTVMDLIVFDDGTGPALYAGGNQCGIFSSTPGAFITRYKNGVWSAVGAGVNGFVNAFAIFDDGTGPALYVGGNFTTAGGQPANRIARWKNGQWSALGSGISGGQVYALAVFDDDGAGPTPPALYAAGSFTSAGGQPAQRIARWAPAIGCYANCDSSTVAPVLNANDFQCFLNAFASGSAQANCDGSTNSPVLNANDFQCFLNAFAAGCP